MIVGLWIKTHMIGHFSDDPESTYQPVTYTVYVGGSLSNDPRFHGTQPVKKIRFRELELVQNVI